LLEERLEFGVFAVEVGKNYVVFVRMLEFENFTVLRRVGGWCVLRFGGNDPEKLRRSGLGFDEFLPVQFAVAYRTLPVHPERSIRHLLNDEADGLCIGKDCLGVAETVTGFLPLAGSSPDFSTRDEFAGGFGRSGSSTDEPAGDHGQK
jgi:hypothetical protein